MRRFSLPILLLAAFALAGCQQIFTTSLGKGLARTSVDLPAVLSQADATDLAAQAQANQDTKLAAALVVSLNAQIGVAVTAANAGLAAAAASSAVVASGAGTEVMKAFQSYGTGETPSTDDISALVTALQKGAEISGVIQAIKYLDPSTGIADPSSVSDTVGATDYVIAACVLAASALDPGVDPTTLDGPSLDAFRADPDVVIALGLIDGAKTLVTDQASLDLLEQLSSMMIPQSP